MYYLQVQTAWKFKLHKLQYSRKVTRLKGLNYKPLHQLYDNDLLYLKLPRLIDVASIKVKCCCCNIYFSSWD